MPLPRLLMTPPQIAITLHGLKKIKIYFSLKIVMSNLINLANLLIVI